MLGIYGVPAVLGAPANTANFAEVEQQVIKEFNKRFPEIKVEMVRAPGG